MNIAKHTGLCLPYCVDKVRQRDVLTMDGLEMATSSLCMFLVPLTYSDLATAVIISPLITLMNEAVPKIHAIENLEISIQPRGLFHTLQCIFSSTCTRWTKWYMPRKNIFMYTALRGGIVIHMDGFLLYSTTKSQESGLNVKRLVILVTKCVTIILCECIWQYATEYETMKSRDISKCMSV
jgi:hypothetical protein